MIWTKLDQHVNEMMTTEGKTFQNFLWSRFLIIVQNVNMIANGKRNRRLNPVSAVVVNVVSVVIVAPLPASTVATVVVSSLFMSEPYPEALVLRFDFVYRVPIHRFL